MKKLITILLFLSPYFFYASSAIDSLKNDTIPVSVTIPDTTIAVMHPNGQDTAAVIAVVDGVIKVITVATAEHPGIGALINNNWFRGGIAAAILGFWYRWNRKRKQRNAQNK